MTAFKGINLLVSFALELAMLAALGYWGFRSGQSLWTQWLLAISIPGLVIIVWAFFFAPRSERRLPALPGIALSALLLLASAFALYMAGQPSLAIGMAIVVVVNRVLVLIWHQW